MEKFELKDTRSGFGEGLLELGQENPDVVALCADLTGSLKMDAFEKKYPDRFFQVGIAEANMMGIAAGLTIGGKIPFTGTFANFSTGRVYDQIRQSIAYSKKNVIRGLHLQTKNSQGKFISVIKGKIFDVVVDLRKNSKTFGMHISTIISEKNSKSIFIPPGFAHGFCSLANENYVVYSCTKYREKKYEIGIKYNDKDLNIRWPIKNVIISKKDKNNLSFEEFRKK